MHLQIIVDVEYEHATEATQRKAALNVGAHYIENGVPTSQCDDFGAILTWLERAKLPVMQAAEMPQSPLITRAMLVPPGGRLNGHLPPRP